MAMVNRPRDFRHHDVVRAIRAARAAGIDPSVRIRTPTGTEYFFGGEVTRPQPKKSKQRDVDFAEGGGSDRMLGRGDRTVTSHAADKQQAGSTGHRAASRGGGRFAEGGKVKVTGGAARPAKGGQCAP